MRLVTFRHEGAVRPGIWIDGAIHEITSHPDLRAALADLGKLKFRDKAAVSESAAELLPPIPDPNKIICVGLNYDEHRVETKRPKADYPTLFVRWPDTQVGHRQPLLCPVQSPRFDYEGELAVVIGRPGRSIPAEEALGHVAGFSCYNDGSVRDWQKHTSQFTPGKNFPASAGFGPWLSVGGVSDPRSMTLTSRLNGVVVQQSGVDKLIFDIPSLIAYISVFTELTSGDVIVTGTPGGVGDRREPQLYMKPGDVVEVEISGVGTLVNPVASAK